MFGKYSEGDTDERGGGETMEAAFAAADPFLFRLSGADPVEMEWICDTSV